jgi:hypothetical protein
MLRLLLAVLLALVTPMLSAHTDNITATIPFKMYEYKPAGGKVQTWSNMAYIPRERLNEVTEKIVNVPKAALTAVIEAAKTTGCSAVNNGSITVSLDIKLEGKLWVVGVGVGSGLSVTFDCIDGVAL